MDSDSLLIETKTVLEGGLDFLDRIPDVLSEDLAKLKKLTNDAFRNLLDKWNKVKLIVPEFQDEKPKEKPKTIMKTEPEWPRTKLRSGSVGDLLDVSTPSETNYVNLISGSHNCVAVTKTRKKSIQNLFKFTPTLNNLYSSVKGDSPKPGLTIVRKFSGPLLLNENNFNMRSDGRFSLLPIQDSYILFGPMLTNTPPVFVIDLETCHLGYTNKRDIQLIDGDTKYLIKFPPDANIDSWIDKIKEVQLYTYIPQSMRVDQSKHVYQSVDEDSSYSYIRQERYLGQAKGEYSYIHSVNCSDCHDSIRKKTSTAEAIIDRSYVNTSSIHSVKSLITHYQTKGQI